MAIPTTIRTYIAKHGKGFRGVAAPLAKPELQIKAAMLRVSGSFLMVIYRATDELDLPHIEKILQRKVSLADVSEGPAEVRRVGKILPLPELLNLKGIIDSRVLQMDRITFESGDESILIETRFSELKKLFSSRMKIATITKAVEEEVNLSVKIIDSIRNASALPTLPAIVKDLIRLKNDPYASGSELVAIIERDPALAVQVMRYAHSPLYGAGDEAMTLDRAVIRVLGFEFVLNLVFGLVVGKVLKMPNSGRMGAEQFWRHSLATATLTRILIETINYDKRPSPAVGYLAGLLHNIGLLYVGHFYPVQYGELMQNFNRRSESDLQMHENALIGVDHTLIGHALMAAWDMPSELVDVATHHHDATYRGIHRYPNLIFIATALLRQYYQLGDGSLEPIDELLLHDTGLDQSKLERAMAVFELEQDHLVGLARQMVA